MSYEMKDMTGSLFINDRKKADKHPDYKGRIKVNGQEYWISGWKKHGKTDWISFAISPKEAPQPTPQSVGFGQPSEPIDNGNPPF